MLTRALLPAAIVAAMLAAPAEARPFVWTPDADETPAIDAASNAAPVAQSGSHCRFADKLTAAAVDAGVSPELVIAVAWAETRCRHAGQRSRKGAIGLMQLMPATARRFGAPVSESEREAR
jgi:soluble lytic murein transglycosylase-like protein